MPVYDDLLQDGYLGLVIAAIKYRTDRGTSFKTYAYPWVQVFVGEGVGQVLNPVSARGDGSKGEYKYPWVTRGDLPLDIRADTPDPADVIDAQRVARMLHAELAGVRRPRASPDHRQRNADLFLELKSGEALGAAARAGLTRGRTQQIRDNLQPVYDAFCERMRDEAA